MSVSTPSTSASTGMSFGDAIVTVFRKYADFSGRATRPEFWWFALFSTIVSSALGAFNLVTPEGVIAVGSSLAGVWSIAVLVPSLAVAVRRLRDTGRSWTNLFWLLLPLAGLIVLIVFWAEPTRPEPTTTPAVA
ncbi:DUF805 domain-containing protein [Pseudolysinimonas yzui]|nr:DUF805 domain-containing protein [Pseudolysinimonas yzui]